MFVQAFVTIFRYINISIFAKFTDNQTDKQADTKLCMPLYECV